MIRGKIAGALLVAAMLSVPAPTFANHGDPIYRIRYYTDSTYTNQVGVDQGDCSIYGTVYSHSGQTTQYETYELLGYCANDGGRAYWEPF